MTTLKQLMASENMFEIVQKPSVIHVIELVSKIPIAGFLSKSRKKNFITWKQIYTWFLMQEGSSVQYAALLTGMDRTTVYHSVQLINAFISLNDVCVCSKISLINNAKTMFNENNSN